MITPAGLDLNRVSNDVFTLNLGFVAACKASDLKPTSRQASKYRRGRGKAFNEYEAFKRMAKQALTQLQAAVNQPLIKLLMVVDQIVLPKSVQQLSTDAYMKAHSELDANTKQQRELAEMLQREPQSDSWKEQSDVASINGEILSSQLQDHEQELRSNVTVTIGNLKTLLNP